MRRLKLWLIMCEDVGEGIVEPEEEFERNENLIKVKVMVSGLLLLKMNLP